MRIREKNALSFLLFMYFIIVISGWVYDVTDNHHISIGLLFGLAILNTIAHWTMKGWIIRFSAVLSRSLANLISILSKKFCAAIGLIRGDLTLVSVIYQYNDRLPAVGDIIKFKDFKNGRVKFIRQISWIDDTNEPTIKCEIVLELLPAEK